MVRIFKHSTYLHMISAVALQYVHGGCRTEDHIFLRLPDQNMDQIDRKKFLELALAWLRLVRLMTTSKSVSSRGRTKVAAQMR